jgi:hypothetical protein
MSVILDPNLHPYRLEVAADFLEGQVTSARFVSATEYQVRGGVASLRREGREDGEQLSQALHGDIIDIYEEVDGFGWGQMRSDGYVGWFDMVALSSPVLPVTRKVSALRTYAFSKPDFKAPPHFLLSLGAQLSETGEVHGNFVRCSRAGWVHNGHLAALEDCQKDPVAIAEKFLNAPYQWGGVESLGLDCSGIVQTSYKACGVQLPRDSYMIRGVGEEVGQGVNDKDLKRGDIVCWPSHVAMMINGHEMIHANSFHMQVVIEDLSRANARIEAAHGPILTIRRLKELL